MRRLFCFCFVQILHKFYTVSVILKDTGDKRKGLELLQKERKQSAVLLAPLAVFALLCVCFAVAGLFPFGSQTVSWCDMNHQTVPLLMDFKDILSGKTSMLLNLQNAGGMSFWGVFFFFLSSPFTFLVIFVPKAEMYLFMNVLVLLKIPLCSVTAAILFRRVFPKLNVPQISCFSAMYSCSGFALMYYQNIVWLDIACLFPLVVLGVWKLCREEKPAVYLFSLSAVIVVSYYLSAMILFWLVMIFSLFFSFLASRRRRSRLALKMALATLAALLLTAVVWLPSLLQCTVSGRSIDLVSSLSSGSILTGFSTTLPILFCTSAAVAAVPLFFLTHRKNSAKRTLLVSYLLLLLPLFVDPIDRMWHLGSYQAFPVRFGYIITMTGLLLAAGYLHEGQQMQLEYPPEKSRPLPTLALAVLTAALAVWAAYLLLNPSLHEKLSHYVNNLWGSDESLYWGLAFALPAAGIFVLLFLLFHRRQISVKPLCILLCALTAVEICFNINVYITPAANDGHTYSNALNLENRIEDHSLYRVKTDSLYFDTNLMGALGYPTLDHYTSLTDGTYMDTLQKMGYSSHWMESHSSGGTVLTDALLAQKYSIVRAGETNGRIAVYQNAQYSIVKQPYTLPFGFVTQKLGSTLQEGDRFGVQNTLYQTFFGRTDSILTRYEPKSMDFAQIQKSTDGSVRVSGSSYSSIVYHILVTKKTALYFDCYTKASRDLQNANDNAFSLTVNNQSIRQTYPTSDDNGLVSLGTFENQIVDIRVDVLHSVNCRSFGVAGIDIEKLQNALQSQPAVQLSAKGNCLSGTVSSGGGWLVLPMRGGSGFTATVNGKAAQVSQAAGMFLAVKLQKGENQIAVRYRPPGLVAGAVCSLLGILAVFFLLYQKKWQKHLGVLETPVYILFEIFAAALGILLYLYPVAVYVMWNLEKLM